jgi:hypothetical protein
MKGTKSHDMSQRLVENWKSICTFFDALVANNCIRKYFLNYIPRYRYFSSLRRFQTSVLGYSTGAEGPLLCAEKD